MDSSIAKGWPGGVGGARALPPKYRATPGAPTDLRFVVLKKYSNKNIFLQRDETYYVHQ